MLFYLLLFFQQKKKKQSYQKPKSINYSKFDVSPLSPSPRRCLEIYEIKILGFLSENKKKKKLHPRNPTQADRVGLNFGYFTGNYWGGRTANVMINVRKSHFCATRLCAVFKPLCARPYCLSVVRVRASSLVEEDEEEEEEDEEEKTVRGPVQSNMPFKYITYYILHIIIIIMIMIVQNAHIYRSVP